MKTIFDLDDEAPAVPARLAMAGGCCSLHGVAPAAVPGSRRRRLWDLGASAHCPVVGLCLPVSMLRRLMQRHATDVPEDDHDLHSQGVARSRHRCALAEALQRELDTRHALAVRDTARIKDTDALLDWWRQQRHGPQMAAALWAVLTHARCTPILEDRVLGDVHMQQHEVGQLARALADRQQQMQAEQARLQSEHRAMAARLDEATRAQALERDRLQAEALQLRGTLLARDARITALQAELAEARRDRPDLPARQALSRQVGEQAARLRELQRGLAQALADNDRLRAAQSTPAAATADGPGPTPDGDAPADAALRDRAVLCVGGRTGAVPAYRQVVESAGARFMHHDGGDEDNLQRLEHTLAAADLVVCQTGCISHDAYWRVKDHCRRTGKRCVFIEQPSASSLQRALGAIPAVARSAAAGKA